MDSRSGSGGNGERDRDGAVLISLRLLDDLVFDKAAESNVAFFPLFGDFEALVFGGARPQQCGGKKDG